MTAPARFKQSDVERFTKGVLGAGVARVRIIADLSTGRMEAIIGEAESPPAGGGDGWDDDVE